jgi:hypothetical protein
VLKSKSDVAHILRLSLGLGCHTKAAASEGGAMIPKQVEDYFEEDRKRVDLDSKALTMLQMAIPNSIIHGFKKCKTAKELWDALKNMYVVLEETRENKKDILRQRYENFNNIRGETMTQQYFRYVQIVDDLQEIGVKLEIADILKNFFRYLPPAWNV